MSYGGAVLLVAAATGAGVLGRRHLAPADLVMLYLLAIAVAAARLGRGPSLVASALSVLAYDVFLVPPFYTIKVEDERHLLTFAMMFLVGLATSHLTQRIRREAELAKAADLRARTEEMRSSLLSAVSHDLRTPLAAITGAASTLRSAGDTLDSAQRADLVDAICVEAERLNRLVRNLLDMTRLESGAVQIQRDWVPLDEVVGSALGRLDDQLSGRAGAGGHPRRPAAGVGGSGAARAAVRQPAGQRRPPHARRGGGDHHRPPRRRHRRGPGRRRGRRARASPPATSSACSRSSSAAPGSAAGGAGLGLAICRAIATVHGGTLLAHNRPDGRGAASACRSRWWAPPRRCPTPSPRTTEPSPSRADPSERPHEAAGPLVLVVDDELQMRRFLRASLASRDFAVVEASSAKEALSLMVSHNPEIVLLDLGLPDQDGVEWTRSVREWSHTPIIVISAREQEGDKVQGAGRRAPTTT